jgi:hypothetical protein
VTLPSVWAGAARALVLGAAAGLGACAAFTGCSTDVNLGGTSDAGVTDVPLSPAEFGDLCEPCSSAQTCPVGATCVQIAGSNTFCATACPRATECDSDDTCALVSTGVGDEVRACVPKSGSCAPAKPPETETSTPLEHCGNLEGPNIKAACTSCDKDDTFCQLNGCYGGWWCNTMTKRCQKPPVSCPS